MCRSAWSTASMTRSAAFSRRPSLALVLIGASSSRLTGIAHHLNRSFGFSAEQLAAGGSPQFGDELDLLRYLVGSQILPAMGEQGSFQRRSRGAARHNTGHGHLAHALIGPRQHTGGGDLWMLQEHALDF